MHTEDIFSLLTWLTRQFNKLASCYQTSMYWFHDYYDYFRTVKGNLLSPTDKNQNAKMIAISVIQIANNSLFYHIIATKAGTKEDGCGREANETVWQISHAYMQHRKQWFSHKQWWMKSLNLDSLTLKLSWISPKISA